mgnify:FL=1|jgi:hypothetical protein|tara:strand:- start:347 stop:490 length:144 start_codon:yes stop_codon:yes gene_type:complete
MARTIDMDGSESRSISERQEKKKKKPYNPYGKGSSMNPSKASQTTGP